MAAYAALVSVMHIVDQIKLHPRPPISLDETQVESLTEKVAFLQEFLEGYSHVGYSREADDVESRIADAAYAAEDVIESHIVDQILAGPTSDLEIKISSIDFYQDLQKVIEDMDSIKNEVMESKEKTGVQDQLARNSRPAPLRSSFSRQNSMVGFDDILLKIMDKLTGGRLDRQIIPIVGMGGIGKTTLARNIYQNKVVMQYFDILVWVTISQEYRMSEILLELLQEGGGNLGPMNEYELGNKLHKKLSSRRYLIIMDDIWDIEVWDQLKFFFPDNNNGSRIMLTTRLSNLASYAADSCSVEIGFLDEENSWNLFSETVFGEEGCPLELEEIGKKIVNNCRGLPLSIVVIGGLLAKSQHTKEYWEYIEENLNSIVNSEDDECCLKLLYMSYNQLPIYLKPCFLYVGVFEEDTVIGVSTLIKLWVAEGFLKPFSGKSMEAIANEYLKELIDRNLILIHKLGSTGNIKSCRIHDLLRDLCLREAQKERFYNGTRQHILNLPRDTNTQRRIVIPKSTSEEEAHDALQSMSLARSLICNIMKVDLESPKCRLLRILAAYQENLIVSGGEECLQENTFPLVNLRYLATTAGWSPKFASSLYLLWNLHTLIGNYFGDFTAPAEIWNMSQLRHIKLERRLYLPDPPGHNVDGRDDIVLENLQTLSVVHNFNFSEEVVKRIPNIKKLKIVYFEPDQGWSSYCPNNFDRLHKLESFGCSFFSSKTGFLQNLTFPYSLKKLRLEASRYTQFWEDILGKVGSLPFLEKFEFGGGSFRTYEWETVEGQFRSLKFLRIENSLDLLYWTTESSHFPRLEHLVLECLKLQEIPSEIGEIPTLKWIELDDCRNSAVISAKKILEEQEELHGEGGLQVRVWD